ncbi:MAG TPA: DUF2934 domain-containing protein [Mesorhizobium sp.]|jgi:hypothetical protein|nr:DUF2934 domain-containing protein [Mesorhizobium sp.]
MNDREEKIRVRAYEIWERQGRTGDPEDHWYEAERELGAEEGPAEPSQDHSEAMVEQTSPAEAVEALEQSSGRTPRREGSATRS